MFSAVASDLSSLFGLSAILTILTSCAISSPGLAAPAAAVHAEHGLDLLQENQPRVEAAGTGQLRLIYFTNYADVPQNRTGGLSFYLLSEMKEGSSWRGRTRVLLEREALLNG